MAYGNACERSGKGVAATRDPVTGAPGIHGQYTPCSQGGIRLLGDPAPRSLSAMRRGQRGAYASLQSALALLEAAEQDRCAIEFVVERGILRVLDMRTGTSSGAASIRIAIDLVDIGLLTLEHAVERIAPMSLRIAQQPVLRRDHSLRVAISGRPASAGTAAGEAVLTAKQVAECSSRGGRPILLQERSVRYDAATIALCAGVVSAGRNAEARASVLARMLSIPSISCATAATRQNHDKRHDRLLTCDATERPDLATTAAISGGEAVVLDAHHGRLYRGATDLVAAQPDTYVARVLSWCADHRRVPVVEQAPEEYLTVDELEARGGAGISDTPILIDTRGAGEEAGRARAAQLERALRAGPRALALMWSDDLEHRGERMPPAPWTMIVAPPERTWAAQLLATRIAVDSAALSALRADEARA